MQELILIAVFTGVAALVLPFVLGDIKKNRRKSPKIVRGLIS